MIAEFDAVFLNDAMSQTHHDYSKITDRILIKTKPHLQRVRKMYSKFDYVDGIPAADVVLELKDSFLPLRNDVDGVLPERSVGLPH